MTKRSTAGDVLAARCVGGRALACLAVLTGCLLLAGCGGADDARLATFVGHWRGHARGMNVYRSGRGTESIGPTRRRFVTLTFNVLRVAGTGAAAYARIRVTSVRIVARNAYFGFLPHRGEYGTLRLRHGIITDTITRVIYCAPGIDECDPIFGPDLDDSNVA